MPIILCPYCGVHLKRAFPTCPACERVLPERTGLTHAPVEADEQPSPPFLSAPEARPPAKKHDFDNNLWNPHPLHSFVRGFIVVTALFALAACIDLQLGLSHAPLALQRSPLAGLVAGTGLALFGQLLLGMYEAIAGSDEPRLVGRKTRSRVPIRAMDTAPSDAIRAAEQEAGIAPTPSAARPVEPPDDPPPAPEAVTPARHGHGPYYTAVAVTVLFAFGQGCASAGTACAGVASALLGGYPVGAFLGALAVRFLRPSRP